MVSSFSANCFEYLDFILMTFDGRAKKDKIVMDFIFFIEL